MTLIFFMSLSDGYYFCLTFNFPFHCPAALSPPLACNERLGAGGGYDTVHAGHKRSYSHCTFCGATPPLAPNRPLAVRCFFSVIFFVICFTIEQITSYLKIFRLKIHCQWKFFVFIDKPRPQWICSLFFRMCFVKEF